MNIKNFLIPLILSFNLFTYAENYEVKMLNQGSEGYMVFEPSVLKINKGDSVTFVATDAAHNSASIEGMIPCLLYTSPSPRDGLLSRMPSSA